MENIAVETSQNVFIEHNIASIGERLLATLIDYTILFFYYLIIASVSQSMFWLGQDVSWEIFLYLPFLLYFLLFEWLNNGRTPGKAALNIQVLRLDGATATTGSYFIRWVFRIVDVTLSFGALAIIVHTFNGRGQRLGDIVAGTTVVKHRRQVGLDYTFLKQLPDNYKVVFMEVANLSEEDIKTISDVLNHYWKTRNKKAIDLMVSLANAMAQKMRVKLDRPPLDFLETIIKDYNYLYRIKN